MGAGNKIMGCAVALLASAIGGLLSVVEAADKVWNSPFVLGPQQSEYRNDLVAGKGPKRWGDLKPGDLGATQFAYNDTGLRQMPKLPPAGVHPRILFTADQLPQIRANLLDKDNPIGQKMWKAVLGWTETLKGTYDNTAWYATPDVFKGSFATHGFVPRFRAGNLKKGLVYQEFINGNVGYQHDGGEIGKIWGIFPLEAFRCLIEGDEAAGKQLGQAVETAIVNYTTVGRDNYGRDGLPSFNVAYTYDLAYKWLSPKAKDLLRQWLIDYSKQGNHFGSFEGAMNTYSNWATFTYRLIACLALEGEPGFHDLLYLGHLRSFSNYYSYGWYASGAVFEGMGKNQLGGDALVMFALRGENIAAHPHVLAYIKERIPRDVVPGSHQFFHYDRWGGLKDINTLDAMTVKYLYPEDPIVDWVYRTAVGEHGEHIGGGRLVHYWNSVLTQAVFAVKPLPQKLTQQQAAQNHLTYFCGERNLFSTRSDWSDEALFLNFQARPVNGGHVFADRNNFSFIGKGEYWVEKRPIAYDIDLNSLVQIDGTLQSRHAPARVVDFVDASAASFVVGDAKYTWDWDVCFRGTWMHELGLKHEGHHRLPAGSEWTPMWETSNDFSFTQRAEAYYDLPVYERLYWTAVEPWDWNLKARKPLLPVEKAYRTAGLVRGAKPGNSYALIIDDIQVDEQTHRYDWRLQLNEHAKIWKVSDSSAGRRQPQQPFERDIYLFHPKNGATEPQPGQAVLLVRFLDADLPAGLEQSIADEHVQFEKRRFVDPKHSFHRLTVTTDVVQPAFKVMLYPFYYQQESLPQTHWQGEQVLVAWPEDGSVDALSFTEADTGKVDLTIRRAGKQLAALDRPVSPSPDRTPRIEIAAADLPQPLQSWDFNTDKGLVFSKGQYSSGNAKCESGVLLFDNKGHQQVELPAVKLPTQDAFTLLLRVQTDKKGPCAIISGDGWSFTLAHWNATSLLIPGSSASVRHTEEKIKQWFIDEWASVAIVKKGQEWTLYCNDQLLLVGTAKDALPADSLRIQFGDAQGNVAYGMLGKIDSFAVYDKALSYAEIQALADVSDTPN
jgi:hypothetical protein